MTGLSEAQVRGLRSVASGPVGAKLSVRTSTSHVQFNVAYALEELGLVETFAHRTWVKLTDAGRQALAELDAVEAPAS